MKAYWSEGEYLSAWVLSASDEEEKQMEALGLSKYVSGWGNKLDDNFVKVIGKFDMIDFKNHEFTMQQAEAYAKPILEAKKKACEERKAKSKASNELKFLEAKTTGKPVVLKRWSEECDGSTEECDIDNLTEYAMPDGSTKVVRSHSW